MTAADTATNAWLAQIPPSEQLAAAMATHAQLWSWALTGAVVLLVSLLALKIGALGRLRGLVDPDGRKPWIAGAVTAAAFTGALLIATAPFALMQGAAPIELAGSDARALLAAIAGWAVFFAVARVRPTTWWAWLGPAAAAAMVAYAWCPYVMDGGAAPAPAPAGPVTAAVEQLIAETGLPAAGVQLEPGAGFDADVTGGFGRARVSVTRAALEAPPAEVRAYVGHLLGHYAHRDILTLALVLGTLVLAGTLAVAFGFAPLARLLAVRGVDHPSDPAGLPLVAIILVGVVVLGSPIVAAVGRAVNVRADQYALDHAREPDGLAAVLIRDWDHKAIAPGPVEEALFYRHPPLASRIRHAVAWKQARRR